MWGLGSLAAAMSLQQAGGLSEVGPGSKFGAVLPPFVHAFVGIRAYTQIPSSCYPLGPSALEIL